MAALISRASPAHRNTLKWSELAQCSMGPGAVLAQGAEQPYTAEYLLHNEVCQAAVSCVLATLKNEVRSVATPYVVRTCPCNSLFWSGITVSRPA